MNERMNKAITRLMLSAMEKAGILPEVWQERLKISPARLDRLRSGAVALSDSELDRITRVFGEPWPSVIINQVGENTTIATETLKLLANLHALEQTANAEKQRQTNPPLTRKSHRGRQPRRVKVA